MRTLLLLLLVLCIGVVFYGIADPPLRESQLQTVGNQQVLHLVGDYYAMGKAQGELLREEIEEAAKTGRSYGFGGVYHDRKEGHDLRHLAARYRDEMDGLADGYCQSLGNIETAHTDDAGPSVVKSFALFGSKTVGGELLMFQSMHYGRFPKAMAVVYHPSDGQDYVMVTDPGFLGGLCGMNVHGIAITALPIYYDSSVDLGRLHRTPAGFLVREALRMATSLDEAVTYLEQVQPADFAIFLVGDGKIPDCRVVERTPDKVASFGPGDPAEHQLTSELQQTPAPIPDCVRRSLYYIDPRLQGALPYRPIFCGLPLTSMQAWARRGYGQMTGMQAAIQQPMSVNDVIAWSHTSKEGDKVGGYQVLLNPTAGDFWLAHNPGPNNAGPVMFQRYSLKGLRCRQGSR